MLLAPGHGKTLFLALHLLPIKVALSNLCVFTEIATRYARSRSNETKGRDDTHYGNVNRDVSFFFFHVCAKGILVYRSVNENRSIWSDLEAIKYFLPRFENYPPERHYSLRSCFLSVAVDLDPFSHLNSPPVLYFPFPFPFSLFFCRFVDPEARFGRLGTHTYVSFTTPYVPRDKVKLTIEVNEEEEERERRRLTLRLRRKRSVVKRTVQLFGKAKTQTTKIITQT